MAAIICPDCGNKISQYADQCPQCGFPLQKFLQKQNITDLTKTLICPKCGDYIYISEFSKEKVIPIQCEFCHTFYVQTDMTPQEFEKKEIEAFKKGYEYFEADTAKQFGHGEFDEKLYEDRREELRKMVSARNARKANNEQLNVPRCPTCHSDNIKKISAGTKAANTLMFGIFGNKRKKQFHCNHCGYEW